MKWPSVLVALLLPALLGAQQSVSASISTAATVLPTHYDTVEVVVQQTDEVKALFRGPDTAAVRQHIVQELRTVGISVIPDSAWKQNPRIPFLLVQVDALRNGHGWYCYVAAAFYTGTPFEGDSTLVGWHPQAEGTATNIQEGTPTTDDLNEMVDVVLRRLASQLWPTQ